MAPINGAMRPGTRAPPAPGLQGRAKTRWGAKRPSILRAYARYVNAPKLVKPGRRTVLGWAIGGKKSRRIAPPAF